MSWEQQQTLERQQYEEEFGSTSRSAYDRFYGQAPAVDRCVEKKMALIASDSGGGDFKRVPPGTHIARCYRVVDLGTQQVTYKGDSKLQRKVMVGWELFGEDEEGGPLQTDDGMPLVISKRYTLSLSDKARLRADLESWRGVAFTAEELKGFDITNLLGKFCMVNVIHATEGDKTYANIATIMPVPKAMKASLPAGVHEMQAFDVTDPDMELFEKFYDKLKETIKASTEWRSRENGPTRATANTGTSFDDVDSDIPF